MKRLQQQILDLGFGDCVKLTGNLPPETVRQYLQAANLFALGTQREGCCNAILEALACGCPVVTTPVGDNDYFVKNSINGSIVSVDSADEMAEAMLAVNQSAWSAESIASTLTTGSWNDVAGRVLEFF